MGFARRGDLDVDGDLDADGDIELLGLNELLGDELVEEEIGRAHV